MYKLTNEEIAKVFAMYLGCKCFDIYDNCDAVLSGVHYGNVIIETKIKKERLFSEVQLLLFPLSKITDEHAIEVAKICGETFLKTVPINTLQLYIICASTLNGSRTDRSIWMENGIIELYTNTGDWGGSKTTSVNSFAIYQHLISKGYAVPLWFGIDHWANGKTAIELGIAIEKI